MKIKIKGKRVYKDISEPPIYFYGMLFEKNEFIQKIKQSVMRDSVKQVYLDGIDCERPITSMSPIIK